MRQPPRWLVYTVVLCQWQALTMSAVNVQSGNDSIFAFAALVCFMAFALTFPVSLLSRKDCDERHRDPAVGEAQ